MDKLKRVKAEIERKINDIEVSIKAGLVKKREGSKKIAVLKQILSFIDSMQEEPISIWHDASEKPEREDLVIETNNGRLIHRQSINNYGMVKRWVYTSDLLNLDNSCNFGKNLQKEPVGNVVDDSDISCDAELCATHTGCKYFNPNKKSNVNHCISGLPLQLRQKKEEPVSEELGDYINELSKQFPEVSFAKLSRIAVRVAKWQQQQDQSTIELAEEHAMLAGMEKMKEEMMANAIDVEVKVDAGGYPYIDRTIELYDYDKDEPLANEGDKYKVILIKEE